MFGGDSSHTERISNLIIKVQWQSGSLRDKRPIERKKQSWTKPNKGTIKLNVDVAYDDNQGHGRLRVVARDYTSKFIYF
jgi:hypothetical protein